MKKFRTIERIIKENNIHWVGDGFRVKQYFPGSQDKNFFERFSPFLLMDYNEPYFFEGKEKIIGVGAHPHRGFETVTLAIAGKVEHNDNRGNSGVIGPGDVQWMTAGSGILHKEYHEREYAKKGRTFHMIQLWVNLPKKFKMTEPRYQALTNKNMGKIVLENNSGEISIIAGEVMGVKGPALTFSPINMYRVALNKNSHISLNEPADYNTGFLVINGSLRLNDEKNINSGDFVLFNNIEGEFSLESLSDQAEVVILSGQPLNEPVVAQGPFVMNTQEEIMQANIDYYSGKFGSSKF
ncbi:MAG: pirin family protein [Fusobacterium gastrosuis]|uniref:pirin family protein n=1 Tax=Fusobacterium gastrosuis TaxID=1755100 RepID=UPI002A8B4980|nr:pirin family protein [Fusobacterium gastrosuis]